MTFPLIRTMLAVALLSAGAAQAQDVVRLGNLRLAHFGAVSYIKEIAPTCGIRVDEKIYARGSDVTDALAAGELDVGAGGPDAAISARAGGAPIFIVAGVAKGGTRLLARPGHRIRTLAALKSKKVGLVRGGIEELLLMAMLLDAGLSSGVGAGRDVQLVYVLPHELNEALRTRHIDAMMQSEPLASQAVARGFGVEVLKPYDTPIGEPVHTMVMSEAFYYRQRPQAERFMRCFVDATRAFMDDPARAEKYVHDVVFKGELPVAQVRSALANAPFSHAVSARHIQVTTDTMVRTGVGGVARPAPPREWMRTDLLDAARKGHKPQ
jgi:NitT/TauT family transport system substrate-binding protein